MKLLTAMAAATASSQAMAQAEAPSALVSLFPFVLIAVVFYFFLIRPKMKEFKQHQEMVASLQKNDKVITGGGLRGKITKLVGDGDAEVEIAKGVTVTALRSTLTKVDK